MKVLLAAFNLSCTFWLFAGVSEAQVIVAQDSRGDEVIVSSPVRWPVFYTSVTQWDCVDPVEVALTYTVREDASMRVARARVTIAGIDVAREATSRIKDLADRQYFQVEPLCAGDVPFAVVHYSESVSSQGNGFGTATMTTERIQLRDFAGQRID